MVDKCCFEGTERLEHKYEEFEQKRDFQKVPESF